MEEEINGLLDEWHVEIASDGYPVIVGRITGDTKGRYLDGSKIHTSRITVTEPLREGAIVNTLNSRYKLGKAAIRGAQVKQASLVLPCGHEDSFEHRFAIGLLMLVSAGLDHKVDPTESMMSYIRQVLEAFCIQVPDIAQVHAVEASYSLNKKGTKESH